MNCTKTTWPLAILLVIVLVPAAYMGAYYGMLTPTPRAQSRFAGVPEYRAEGRLGELIFLPAHEVDRRVRPGRWYRKPLI